MKILGISAHYHDSAAALVVDGVPVRHPEEYRHTLAEVQSWFDENGIEYVRAYPRVLIGEDPEELFALAADNWRLEAWLAQLGWIRALGQAVGCSLRSARRSHSERP